MPDVTLAHPDLDRQLVVPDHQAPAFMQSGWEPVVAVVEPPNKGAKVDEWHAYADLVGIVGHEDMSKQQIIAAVEAAAAAVPDTPEPAGEPADDTSQED